MFLFLYFIYLLFLFVLIDSIRKTEQFKACDCRKEKRVMSVETGIERVMYGG